MLASFTLGSLRNSHTDIHRSHTDSYSDALTSAQHGWIASRSVCKTYGQRLPGLLAEDAKRRVRDHGHVQCAGHPRVVVGE